MGKGEGGEFRGFGAGLLRGPFGNCLGQAAIGELHLERPGADVPKIHQVGREAEGLPLGHLIGRSDDQG